MVIVNGDKKLTDKGLVILTKEEARELKELIDEMECALRVIRDCNMVCENAIVRILNRNGTIEAGGKKDLFDAEFCRDMLYKSHDLASEAKDRCSFDKNREKIFKSLWDV